MTTRPALALASLLLLMATALPAYAADYCWKDTDTRGVGEPAQCAPGEENRAGICYGGCPTGWETRQLQCVEECRPGWTERGDLRCKKGTERYWRATQPRREGVAQTCSEGFELGIDNDSGVRCFPQCGPDQNGIGPVCWTQCPATHPHQCGAGCATSPSTCASAIVDMVSAPLEVALNIAGLVVGAPGAGKTVGEAIDIATEAVGVASAIVNTTTTLTHDQSIEVAETTLDMINQGLDPIAELDPIGVVALYQAFSYNKCGRNDPFDAGMVMVEQARLNSYPFRTDVGGKVVDCANLCYDTYGCKSANFEFRSKTCSLFWDSAQTNPGAYEAHDTTIYLENDGTTTPPTPTPTPGNALDSFEQTYGMALGGHNNRIVENVTKEACAQICLDDSQCRSADYRTNDNRCHISHADKNTAPGSYEAYTNHVYLHRVGTPVASALDSFDQTYGMALGGHNDRILDNVSKEFCAQACLDDSQSRSADYRLFDNRCHISHADKFSAASDFRNYADHVYLHRR